MKELFSLWVEKELKERLEKIAKKEDRSLAYLVNQAIKEFLERREK